MNGTSDFYPRKRNFEFSSRDAFNNTWMMRRDRYFQFNRDSYGRYPVWQQAPRWYKFRRVPKEWQSWFQYCRPQDARPKAAPSFGAVNPHQPFIPRPPFNHRVTIPNFSGVHPPDLFVFRNSSAKSAKVTSAPTGKIPQPSSCFESNKDVRSIALQSKETEVNDDVQYLYTVQTKGDELVEVVNLSEGSEDPSRLVKTRSDYFLRSDSIASSDGKEGGIDKTISKILEKGMEPSSKKQYAAPRKGRKRKKSSEDLHCVVCESDYEFVKNKGEEIFKSRCGHMFCQQCLKKLDPYKCPECNLYLQKLFKVFL